MDQEQSKHPQLVKQVEEVSKHEVKVIRVKTKKKVEVVDMVAEKKKLEQMMREMQTGVKEPKKGLRGKFKSPKRIKLLKPII